MATIAIIEDDEPSQALMTYLLEVRGHRVECAPDGEAGLALVRAERPDLLLCDLGLPGMDGIEVLAHLRADPGLSSLPVVVVTAAATVGDRARLLAAGFDGYLAKPIAPELFAQELEPFLRGRAAQPAD